MPTADPLAPARPGEVSPLVVSLPTINTVLDAIRNLPSPRGQLRASGDEVNQRLPVPHSSVLVRNDTGVSAPPLSILKLGNTLLNITTQQHDIFRHPAFEGTTPEAQSDQFCVLLDGAGVGKITHAAIRGEAVCYVTVSDTAHKWAAPDPGSTGQLLSGESGPARILSTLTGTGRQLCCVLIDDRGDRQVREVVNEEPLNSEPATEETLYAADEPTTATPAFQMGAAENYTGAGGGNLPGAWLAMLPEGTAGDAAYFVDATTTTVNQQITLNSVTSSFEWNESGGDISLAFTNLALLDFTDVAEIDLTGVTVTGFSGGSGMEWELLGTVAHGALTDADSSQDITVDTLPAKTVIMGLQIRTKTVGSGGGVGSLSMTPLIDSSPLGNTGNGLNANDTSGYFYPGYGGGAEQIVRDWTGTTTVGIRFSADVDVADLTAGEWELYGLVPVLP